MLVTTGVTFHKKEASVEKMCQLQLEQLLLRKRLCGKDVSITIRTAVAQEAAVWKRCVNYN